MASAKHPEGGVALDEVLAAQLLLSNAVNLCSAHEGVADSVWVKMQ